MAEFGLILKSGPTGAEHEFKKSGNGLMILNSGANLVPVKPNLSWA